MSHLKVDGAESPRESFEVERDRNTGGFEGVDGKKTSVTKLPADKSKGCDWKNIAKWTAVALAIVALVPGFAGLLIYFGKTPGFLSFLGQFSKNTGMWTGIGGFATTVAGAAAATVLSCLGRKNAPAVPRDADDASAAKKCWNWVTCQKPEYVKVK